MAVPTERQTGAAESSGSGMSDQTRPPKVTRSETPPAALGTSWPARSPDTNRLDLTLRGSHMGDTCLHQGENI